MYYKSLTYLESLFGRKEAIVLPYSIPVVFASTCKISHMKYTYHSASKGQRQKLISLQATGRH